MEGLAHPMSAKQAALERQRIEQTRQARRRYEALADRICDYLAEVGAATSGEMMEVLDIKKNTFQAALAVARKRGIERINRRRGMYAVPGYCGPRTHDPKKVSPSSIDRAWRRFCFERAA